MDFVPPLPSFRPDDDPEPTDAPDQDETDARAALLHLRDGLGPWLAMASLESLRAVEWRRMAVLLWTVADLCAKADGDEIAIYTPASISFTPHPPVPQGDECMRCGLPANEDLHIWENADKRRTPMKAAKLITEIAVMLEKEGNVRVQVDAPGAIYDIDAVTFAPDEEIPTIYIGTR